MSDAEAAAVCSHIVVVALFMFVALAGLMQLAALWTYLDTEALSRVRRACHDLGVRRSTRRVNRSFDAIVATYHREQ